LSQTISRKKALIIAVSDYDESSNLKNLPFCKNDGNEMLALLKNTGYEIKNVDGLIGHTDGTLMQDCIYSFFNDDIKSADTLLFYFSGHGVPGKDDFFLSSSNIDQSKPKMRGFSFADLSGEIIKCHAKRVVTILDSCYAGSLNLSGKGNESALVTAAENQISATFKEGEGRCLLSSCMGFQESFATAEGNHSFFTNYLLKGLRGADGKSVDERGIVTPESLMQYVDSAIDELPKENRPTQTPFRKIESAGKIMLAAHPKFAHATKAISETRTKIRKILAELLSNGNISERILTSALAISKLDPLPISGKEKQQWDLLERLLQNEISVGEFSESWLEWEQSKKSISSEIQINEKKECMAAGDICTSNKSYEEAIKWYDKALEIDPVDQYVIRSKGSALVELGRYDEAIKLYDEGLKIVPNLNMWHTWIKNFRQKAIEKQEASKSHDAAMDFKEKPDQFTTVDFWNNKGLELFHLGKYKEAIEALDKAISINPNNTVVWNNKGLALDNLFKYKEAIEALDKAISINPNNVDAWYNKGLTLIHLGKYKEAIKACDKAISINPNNSNAWNNKGSALIHLGKYKEAIKACDKAISINPNNTVAWNNKGSALENLGKHKEAIEAYGKATNIDQVGR
jgi:tetratricopeptide (TPR) repeat protein